MNTTDKTDEQIQLEQAVVRFTAQLHDLERERQDSLNALNAAQSRLNAIKTIKVKAEQEEREREQLEYAVTRLRSFIEGNAPSKARTHAETVLKFITQGVYPSTSEALKAVSVAINGFKGDRSGRDYQARQTAIANTLALLPTKPGHERSFQGRATAGFLGES